MKNRFLLLMATLCIALSTYAYDFKSGMLYYNITRSTAPNYSVEVVPHSSYSIYKYIVIPQTVTYNGITYKVTGIGQSAFLGCAELQTIIGAENITYIEDFAFWGCKNLTEIPLPDNMSSIGQYAFRECSGLTSFTIPEGITDISFNTFQGCTGLTSVTIPSTVEIIRSQAFDSCVSLTSVTLPPDMDYIQSRAFAYCESLTSIRITGSAEADAFVGCEKLESVILSPNAGISTATFSFCSSITSIVVEEGNYWYDSRDSCNAVIEKQTNTLVFGCRTTTIPNTVKKIGKHSFMDCIGGPKVIIPNSVTSIESGAFSCCEDIDITIPNSVTDIGAAIMGGCTGAVTWNIKTHKDWKQKQNSPLYGANITSFTVGENVQTLPLNLCTGMDSLNTLIWDARNCSKWSDQSECVNYIDTFVVGENVKNISCCTFKYPTKVMNMVWKARNCRNENGTPIVDGSYVSSVSLGDKVEHIPAYMCQDMSKLTSTSITIPKSVSSIGEYAFDGCNLTSIVWNAKQCAPVEEWGKYYYGPFGSIASQITSFTFGDEVESVPNYLCYNMGNITTITIPKSVTFFGNRVFRNCAGLISITWYPRKCTIVKGEYENYMPLFGYISNYNLCSHVKSFTLGDEVEQIPPCLCCGMDSLPAITLPESLTHIGYNAFGGCRGLTSIIIPEKVDSIESEAFHGCRGLTSIRIPKNVRYIGGDAFSQTSISSIEYNAKSAKFGSPYIGEGAFYDICGQIESFVIGNDVDSLPMNLCLGMKKLTSVTIPKNVKYMDYYIFGSLQSNYCTSLTHITMESPIPPKIVDGCFGFWGIEHRFFIYVPCGSQEAYRETEHWDNKADWIFEPAATYTLSVQSANEEQGATTILQPNTCSSDEAIIAADPNIGYNFVQWSDGNTDNPRTVVVTQDTIFTAEFVVGQYTITTTDSEYGTISGAGTYTYGTEIALTATADEHYHFTQWSDGNTDNPRTVSVEGDATYTAEFAIDQHTITANAQNGNVSGGGTYDYGTTATLTATANEHYHFTQWSDGNTDNPRTVSVVGDATYTAEFKPNSYTITVSAGEHGSANGGGTYDYGTTATLTATADEHYHFTQWTDGNTDNPRTISVEGDATYTAEFAIDKHTITITCDPQQGNVTGAGTYNYGTQVTLIATANSGYEFSQWSNGVTYNPYLFTATEDLTLEAQFIPTTAVENVSADSDTTVRKVFRDGQVLILRGGKTYTTTGVEVK